MTNTKRLIGCLNHGSFLPSTDEMGGYCQKLEMKVKGEFEVNKPIGAEAFEIDYPPATLFRDRVSGEDYVILDDGTRLLVDASDFKNRYQEFVPKN